MSRWVVRILIVVVLVFLVEFYAFQAITTITSNKIFLFTWLFIGLAVYINFFYIVLTYSRAKGQTKEFQWAVGLLITVLLPKLFIFIVLLGEDVFRGILKLISVFSDSETKDMISRRVLISQLALGLAGIPFIAFIYGIIKGKYNYKVLKHDLSFSDLPAAFEGYTITQISDIHSGSFTNREKIVKAVNLINKQQSDLLLFTGDIVNNKAEEMDNWIDVFDKLYAKDGKYSILGNHDYGDYNEWESKTEKANNFIKVKEIHQKIGFDLLCNEHRYLEKDGEKIALVGVENWGKGGFQKKGDLKKATQKVSKEEFKILMSHDPSHWDAQVKDNDFNYHLTLSGHTHGLQMGIEIPGWFKWSPSKYVYKQWAGLYQEAGRYIHVNRGFGFHAFPGRVGIWPEITVITLKKA